MGGKEAEDDANASGNAVSPDMYGRKLSVGYLTLNERILFGNVDVLLFPVDLMGTDEKALEKLMLKELHSKQKRGNEPKKKGPKENQSKIPDVFEPEVNGFDTAQGAEGLNTGSGGALVSGEEDATTMQARLHCEVCDVFVTGEEPMKSHLTGKNHQKNARQRSRNANSENLPSTEALESQIAGDAQEEEANPNLPDSEETGRMIQEKILSKKIDAYKNQLNHLQVYANGTGYCGICNVPAASAASLQAHLEGKRHQARLLGAADVVENPMSVTGGPGYACDYCGVRCQTEFQLKEHQGGKKHLRSVKIFEQQRKKLRTEKKRIS